MLNREKFMEVFTGLCDMYGKIPSEFMLDTYFSIFQDYTAEEFGNAVQRCLKERVYNNLPKPAEILEFLEGTKDDKALTAWLQVMEAVRKGGYYASIVFTDPIIPRVVNELGGWQEFCCTQKDELPFIQKRFMDLYRLFLKREQLPNEKLIGFIEARNMQSGHTKEIPEPIEIGFMEEQKQIENK